MQITRIEGDNSVYVMKCDNYDGCDSQTNRCANPPVISSAAISSGTSEDSPSAVCSDNDARCDGGVKFMCGDNKWLPVQVCDNGCDGNECKVNVIVPEGKCTAGEFKCE